MKYAADFRGIARACLRGKWLYAVAAGLAATLLGGISSNGPEVTFDIGDTGARVNLEMAGQMLYSTGEPVEAGIRGLMIGSGIYLILLALVLVAVYFVLGSVVGVGYARFNLDLVDGEHASFAPLFSYFSYWKTTAVARLLQTIYILLWSLLLVIPGIVASYSYAMTDFVLAEHPEWSASEAIARSKELMYGNRWRLFCLHFSFIGWHILCIITLGIGNLWLTPYIRAAETAFYRDISCADSLAV